MKQRSESLISYLEANPLKQWRVKKGVTQEMLAMKLGISFATIQRWEHGSVAPKADNYEKLAGLLQIEDDSLRKQWTRWLATGKDVSI